MLPSIFFTRNGDGVPRIKKFLKDNSGLTPETIWTAKEVETNDNAKKHTVSIFSDLDISVFDTPKPERLIERIISLSTNSDDIILDSFLGSGTTAAVAHKMKRKWIGIELGEHASSHCLPRLRKVVIGKENGGITEAVNWKGGGGFRFSGTLRQAGTTHAGEPPLQRVTVCRGFLRFFRRPG